MDGKRMDGGCTDRGMDGWRENGDADAKHSALFFLLGHALVVKL